MTENSPKIIWADGTETPHRTITAGPQWVAGATRDVLDITLPGLTLPQAQQLGKDGAKVGQITVVMYEEAPASAGIPAVTTEQRSGYSGYSIYAGVYDDEAGNTHLKLACELVQREQELMQKVSSLTAQNSELQGTVDTLILDTLNGGETA